MVGMAVDGAIDFSQADPYSRSWRTSFLLRMRYWLSEREGRWQQLRQHRLLESLRYASEESWEAQSQQEAQAYRKAALQMLLQTGGDEEPRQQMAQRLTQLWESNFGSLKDPETQRKIDEVAEAMRRTRLQQQ